MFVFLFFLSETHKITSDSFPVAYFGKTFFRHAECVLIFFLESGQKFYFFMVTFDLICDYNLLKFSGFKRILSGQ